MRLSQIEAQMISALLDTVSTTELNDDDFDTFHSMRVRIDQMVLDAPFLAAVKDLYTTKIWRMEND